MQGSRRVPSKRLLLSHVELPGQGSRCETALQALGALLFQMPLPWSPEEAEQGEDEKPGPSAPCQPPITEHTRLVRVFCGFCVWGKKALVVGQVLLKAQGWTLRVSYMGCLLP